MSIITVGIDLAKRVFAVCGTELQGIGAGIGGGRHL